MLTHIDFMKQAQAQFARGVEYGRYVAYTLNKAAYGNPYDPMTKQAQDAVADAQMIADQVDNADAALAAGNAAAGDAGASPAEQIACPSCGNVVVMDPNGACPVCGFNIAEALMASMGGAPEAGGMPPMAPEEAAMQEQVVQAAQRDPNFLNYLLSNF